MHFDATIQAGSLISAAIFLIVGLMGWYAFRARVDVLIENHAELMRALTARFESHEDRDEEMFEKVQNKIGDLAAGVQRLVGQNEVFRRVQDRRDS
jgi:amino acid permease